jgi:hypothetical protein
MSSRPASLPTLKETVEEAVRELVSVQAWGESVFVSLPLINPDGSPSTVRVRRAPGGFSVDDNGFSYRALESVGSERSFARTAAAVASVEDLVVDKQVITTVAGLDDLERAIIDVATASWSLVDKVFESIGDEGEAQLSDYLQARLGSIFGASKIEAEGKISGSSTKPWKVSAIVRLENEIAVFQAVGDHPNSIYRVSAAFHDLAALMNPPILISVVKDKAKLGANLSLLAQAGRVIQGDQPDDVYKKAAA